MNLTAEARNHAVRVEEALKQVETTIADWQNGTLAKDRFERSLDTLRESLRTCIDSNNNDAILNIPVPVVIGSNVILNLRKAETQH